MSNARTRPAPNVASPATPVQYGDGDSAAPRLAVARYTEECQHIVAERNLINIGSILFCGRLRNPKQIVGGYG